MCAVVLAVHAAPISCTCRSYSATENTNGSGHHSFQFIFRFNAYVNYTPHGDVPATVQNVQRVFLELRRLTSALVQLRRIGPSTFLGL